MKSNILSPNHFLARFEFNFRSLDKPCEQGLIKADDLIFFENHLSHPLAVTRTGEVVSASPSKKIPLWVATINISEKDNLKSFRQYRPRMECLEESVNNTAANISLWVQISGMAPDFFIFCGDLFYLKRLKKHLDDARFEHPNQKELALKPVGR